MPDGLVFVDSPLDGNMHDMTMFCSLGIAQWLSTHAMTSDGIALNLGCSNLLGLSTPFCSNWEDISAQHMLFNRIMSRYQVTVEWSIGSVSMLWGCSRDMMLQKISLTPIGAN
uniref:Uncharacterized protein n=1 Tax=Melanopsichium pennsylvanicum 4 TaxID=1398559 RepID=A0A077QYZ6_9BASI|nr:uncharacterized protein BN887_06287 [Melanopsichium pennsylvanicum 4]